MNDRELLFYFDDAVSRKCRGVELNVLDLVNVLDVVAEVAR